MSAALEVRVYRNWPEDQDIARAWDDLVLQTDFPNVFLTWEWLRAWWSWFGGDDQLRLCLAFEGTRLVGIAPFYATRMPLVKVLRGRVLRWVGDGAMVAPDFLGPVVRPGDAPRFAEALTAGWDSIMGPGEFVLLSDSLPTAAGTRSLCESLAGRYELRRQEGVRCPTLTLPSTYDAFLAGLSGKTRKAVRYRHKKASKAFAVEMRCITTVEELGPAFETVRAIFAQSVRGLRAKTGFLDERYFGFQREVGAACCRQGWIRLYILTFDGAPVAFLYGYQYGGRFWFYQTAFAPVHRDYSPGALLLQLVIAAAIEEGTASFEFLRGDESYKYHLTDEERTTETVALLPKGSRAAGLYRLDGILRKAKKRAAAITRGISAPRNPTSSAEPDREGRE